MQVSEARAFGVARRIKVSQQLHGLLAAQAAAPVALLRLMRVAAGCPAGCDHFLRPLNLQAFWAPRLLAEHAKIGVKGHG